jgi:hypothetical protein
VSVASFDLDQPADPVERAAPRRPWRRIGVVVLLAVVVVALFSADQRSRQAEFGRLFDQVQGSQGSIVYADRQVAGVVQYTSPQLTSASAPATVRAGLSKIVQETAAAQVGELQLYRERIAALTPVRWHPEQRRARDAYLTYLDDRIDRLLAIAVDLDELYRPQPQRAVLLAAARRALIAATDGSTADRARNLLAENRS